MSNCQPKKKLIGLDTGSYPPEKLCHKKIDWILQMQKPENLLQIHRFLDAQLCGFNAHTFSCTYPASLERKLLVGAYVMRLSPWFGKNYHIYTDACSYHIGECIFQDDKPVASWSHKLIHAQLKYEVGDKELLSIVKVLMELCTMLLGAMYSCWPPP